MLALLTNAFTFILAQETTTTGGDSSSGSGFGNITLVIYIVLFIGIFYFLLIRPGQKQRKQHAEVVDAIRKGDEVLSAGGIYGTVTKVGDDFVMVEIAKKTEVKLSRNSIARRISVEAAAAESVEETDEPEASPDTESK